MQPKLHSKSAKAPAAPPLKAKRGPSGPQSEPTPSREQVRGAVHLVRAPRQTQRPVERKAKKGK